MRRLPGIAFALLLACPFATRAETSPAAIIGMPSVASLTALRTADMADGTIAIAAGFKTAGDGGGGLFLWLPKSTQAPDGVFTVGSTDQPQGRWSRQLLEGSQIRPEVAGAVGDGHTDDEPAFQRLIALSRRQGTFTILLTPGRSYYMAHTLDVSLGAPGLEISGPASPRIPSRDAKDEAPPTRLELDTAAGATVKLGAGQTLRNVLVWRHGLNPGAASLTEVRDEVAKWYAEDGKPKPLSRGVFAPFNDSTVEGCMIVGFHTGIQASGERFKLRHDLIDAAGYAVEVAGSRDTSLIEDVQTRALWSLPATGRDALGDHSYRPGTAYFVHDGADGLQMNSVMAIGWATGIWIAGSTDGSAAHDDWMISILQPNVETPSNSGQASAGIKTSGGVRRLTIIDPRIVASGGDPDSAALDFGQTARDQSAAANNNVTVIGGTLEVASRLGSAVLLRQGSTGTLIGVTMNQIQAGLKGPLVRAMAGIGEWKLLQPEIRGTHAEPWLVAPSDARTHLSMQ